MVLPRTGTDGTSRHVANKKYDESLLRSIVDPYQQKIAKCGNDIERDKCELITCNEVRTERLNEIEHDVACGEWSANRLPASKCNLTDWIEVERERITCREKCEQIACNEVRPDRLKREWEWMSRWQKLQICHSWMSAQHRLLDSRSSASNKWVCMR